MCVRFSVCPPRVEFLFFSIVWNSCSQTPFVFKARFSGAPPISRLLSWEASHGAQDFHSCGRTSVLWFFSSSWVTQLVGMGLEFIVVLLLSYCGFSFVIGYMISFWVSRFSGSVMSKPLHTHGLQHARLPCPSPTPGAYSNTCPLSRWWPDSRFTSTCQQVDQGLSATGLAPVSQLISTCQPLDKHLSASWLAPVSHLINTCHPVDQHLSASWSAPVSRFISAYQPLN